MNDGGFISIGEVARMLGVSIGTVRRNPGMPQPHHRASGGHRRYRRADIEAYLASLRTPAPELPAPELIIENDCQVSLSFHQWGYQGGFTAAGMFTRWIREHGWRAFSEWMARQTGELQQVRVLRKEEPGSGETPGPGRFPSRRQA